MNATAQTQREGSLATNPVSRWLELAWKVVVASDLGVLGYGVVAATKPDVLTPGFEAYVDRSWTALVADDPRAAEFILLGFRLLGWLNIAVAVALLGIGATAFRRGERWSWWALLAGNTLAYGAPMAYDQAVGSVGAFEMLEYVALFAVYAALAATASIGRPAPPAHDPLRTDPPI